MNSLQINRLSEILGNLSLLFFATMILPGFAGTVVTETTLLSGTTFTILCTVLSLVLLKGEKGKNGHTI